MLFNFQAHLIEICSEQHSCISSLKTIIYNSYIVFDKISRFILSLKLTVLNFNDNLINFHKLLCAKLILLKLTDVNQVDSLLH